MLDGALSLLSVLAFGTSAARGSLGVIGAGEQLISGELLSDQSPIDLEIFPGNILTGTRSVKTLELRVHS